MTKDYSLFTADDFIIDDFFLQWVRSPNVESNAFWKHWIAAHPQKQEEIKQAINFIVGLHFEEVIPDDAYIEQKLHENLANISQRETLSYRYRGNLAVKKNKLLWAVAAVFTGFVAFSFWHFDKQKPVMIHMVTGADEIKKIELPDHSMVTLNANSGILYAANMQKAEKRELWLEGEAFFNIRHIETDHIPHRFIVYNNDLNVEVLGTTFNIRKKDQITNVTLNSGKIKIDIKNEPGSTILMQPGDFLQYSQQEKSITKKHVAPELYSLWKEEKISLENMPLSDISQLIEDTYGYRVNIVGKGLATEKISGTLVLKDEHALLETLSLALDIEIIKKDRILIFQSKNNIKTN